MTELLFVPPPTRQHLVKTAIMQATRSAARRRPVGPDNVEIDRVIPPWSKPLRRRARYKGASGGRGSGKSHFFGEEAVERMVEGPALRFLCIREVQRSMKFSAKSLIEAKIKSLGVGHLFTILSSEIRHAQGTGVMIFEGMQDHTAQSIKSLEGFDIAWVEEAQSISKRSLDLLLPTIRKDGSEIWFSWNPESPADAVDSLFTSLGLKTPGISGDAVRVHSTYRDNPMCPEATKVEAARLKEADPDSYEHIWEGGYFLGGHGRVYSTYSGKPFPEGNIDETIVDSGGELLVGMDFNVNPMSAVIGERAVDQLLIHDAIEIQTSNTQEMADELKRRYPPIKDRLGRLMPRRIVICPDPAGKQRKTSAPVGQTDFTILQNAGFEVRAPNAAPPVVDRENNAKAMYHDLETGRRRVRIHPRATALTTALANLTYKDGTSQRDKKSGYDHICDAADYLMWQEFNVLTAPRVYGSSRHKV